ncbi:uncharacterized protein [Littorina saxatilis]|uniref:uncharacterized protein n=1 Tax=Littorina saxatilis TaxID=31220 RepID=UPI0038B61889
MSTPARTIGTPRNAALASLTTPGRGDQVHSAEVGIDVTNLDSEHELLAAKGRALGIRSGSSLARYVQEEQLSQVQIRKQLAEQKLTEEEARMRQEEARRKQKREEEEARRKQKREEEEARMRQEEAKRKQEREEEEARRKQEREEEEQRRRQRLYELEEAKLLAELERTRTAAAAPAPIAHDPAIQPVRLKIDQFDETKEELDTFLGRFERAATLSGWNGETWGARLGTLLTGFAADVYLELPLENASNYDAVVESLRSSFRWTADAYRSKFRQATKNEAETFNQYATRLRIWFERWRKSAKKAETYEDLRDLILTEHLMDRISGDLGEFIRQNNPANLQATAELAECYAASKRARKNPVTVTGRAGGNKNSDSPKKNAPPIYSNPEGQRGKCFNCGQEGHKRRNCPRPARSTNVRSVTTPESNSTMKELPALCGPCGKLSYTPLCTVMVNGAQVSALRDTGADGLVIDSTLVKDCDLMREGQTIRLAAGNVEQKCFTTVIHLESPFFSGEAVAIVADQLTYPVLIGNRIIRPGGETLEVPVYKAEAQPLKTAVVTRSQHSRDKESPKSLKMTDSGLGNVTREDLIKLQNQDPTLSRMRELARGSDPAPCGKRGQVQFIWKRGILQRRFITTDGTYSQVVIPESLRAGVLSLSHDVPMAGHLGTKKTHDRLWQSFYWPGMGGDIRRYVQSCDACQRALPKGRIHKVPLGKMPLIDEPFKRLAVDIVGPLTISERKNRYILVTVDYATRYPEATPLPSIEAERVAEALWEMYTRVGVPSEVLTDRGSQFVSDLMNQGGTAREPWIFTIRTPLWSNREGSPNVLLKELWTKDPPAEVRTTAEYVVDLRQRLEDTLKLAQQNLDSSSRRYAKAFDRRAVKRKFKIGSRVLLLIPLKRNKLEMAWQGPYEVVGKVGEQDYRLRIGSKEKLYHANLLKQYVERESQSRDTCKRTEADVLSCTVVVEETGATSEEDMRYPQDIPLPSLQPEEGPDDIQCNPELTDSQRNDVKLLGGKFGKTLTDLPGNTQLEEFSANLLVSKPVFVRPRPIPYSQTEAVKREVEAMLKMGVIEPVSSPYNAPIVLVKKKDGKVRFCIDYRQLNRVTVFDGEPLPNVDELFSRLGRAKFFSKIDLSKGYWQIPVYPPDKEKLAFIVPQGQFTWTKMPFGLQNAVAVFSRMMRKLLKPLNRNDVYNFMDDILVATQDWKTHLQALCAVFHRLEEAGLTARPTKCVIGFSELDYLGHHVGHGLMWPEAAKVEKIQAARRPETKKDVRAFLGLVGFYRRYVPNFAAIALPLTDLTRKNLSNRVEWTDRCEEAYQTLRQMLSQRPVICVPDLSLPFVLQTDASDIGLGAVLLQDHGGELKPVSFASRKLNNAEKNYATVEKECLAIVWAIRKFEVYLYGREFELQTDHQSLQHLQRSKTSNGRLMRWALLLQSFSFRVTVIRGRDNVGADYYSRIVQDDGHETNT